MLNFVPDIAEEHITLKHCENVFHDALTEVRKGKTHFHVTDPEGQVPDYDLEYIVVNTRRMKSEDTIP